MMQPNNERRMMPPGVTRRHWRRPCVALLTKHAHLTCFGIQLHGETRLHWLGGVSTVSNIASPVSYKERKPGWG